MSKLSILPQFGSRKDLETLQFAVMGIAHESGARVSFEDATHGMAIPLVDGSPYIYVAAGSHKVEGNLKVDVPVNSSQEAISIYASVELQKEDGEYELVDLLSSVFFLRDKEQGTFDGDISISQPFVGLDDKTSIVLNASPDSRYSISVNEKNFVIHTNETGYGSISFRGQDIVDGNSVKVVQKFSVLISYQDDNYVSKRASGAYIHVLPDRIAAFASCSPTAPDDECLDASKQLAPEVAIDVPSSADNIRNSSESVEDCGDVEVAPSDIVCSIQDYSSVIIDNNISLTAIVGQDVSDNISKVFVVDDATISSDRAFSKRFATIPPGTGALSMFVDEDAFAMAQSGWQVKIDHSLFENLVLTVAGKLPATSIPFPTFTFDDTFAVPEWLVCIPYTLLEPLGCNPALTFPSELENNGLVSLPIVTDLVGNQVHVIKASITATKLVESIQGLTYVYVIAEAIVGGISQLFLYSFVAQAGSSCLIPNAPTESTFGWQQLTFNGENKNPKAIVDRSDNLHIFWESDRSGITQVYYSVLGPSSGSLMNSTLSSAIDKQVQILQQEELPRDLIVNPIMKLHDPFELILTQVCDEYLSNTMWMPYTDLAAGSVVIDGNSDIRIVGNPSTEQAMAFTILDEDRAGAGFDGFFKERSFAISFTLKDNNNTTELEDNDIETVWQNWKSQYTPTADVDHNNTTVHTFGDNKFVLGREDRYFDRFVPILGSYKNEELRGLFDECSTGSTDPFVATVQGSNSNLRHFMLGIMPEKVRFEATNTQTFTEYCDENNLSIQDCLEVYSEKDELVTYTGRYKLFVVINTEPDYVGNVGSKLYSLSRQFSSVFTLDDIGTSINLVMHYKKMFDEEVVGWMGSNSKDDPSDLQNKKRFLGSLNIDVDGEMEFSESFMVDLSDQRRTFEIGVGMPGGGQYVSNDFKPFETMVYENIDVDLQFENLVIGSPNVLMDNKLVSIPQDTRFFNAMTVKDTIDDSQSASFIDTHGLLSFGIETLGFPEIPLTFEGYNKSISVAQGLSCNDMHIVWESNRDLYWNVVYSHSTNKAMPFRFDTRITNSERSSLVPAIGIDADGTRMVAWHEKVGDKFQIFAAKGFSDLSTDSPICTSGISGNSGAACFVPEADCGLEFEYCHGPCKFDAYKTLFVDDCSTLEWCDPSACYGGGCNVVLRSHTSGGTQFSNSANASRLIAYQCAAHDGSRYIVDDLNRVVLKTFYGGINNTRLDATDGPFFAGGAGAGEFLNFKPYWFSECGVGGYKFSDSFWTPDTSEAQQIYQCVSSLVGSNLPAIGVQHTLILHLSFWRDESQSDDASEVKLVRAFILDC